MSATTKVRVEPIGDSDVAAACHFLHQHMDPDISLDTWREQFSYPWADDKPNHGFMLRNGDEIVGLLGVIYSEQTIKGRPERFCNLASWFVLESFRAYSMWLLLSVLRQDGIDHVTALTANDDTAKLYRAMKFQPLPAEARILATVAPFSANSRDIRIHDDSAGVESRLPVHAYRIWADHRECRLLEHAVIGHDGAFCHVAYKQTVRRRLKGCTVLHVSDRDLFDRGRAAFLKHVRRRNRALFAIVQTRHLKSIPKLSLKLADSGNALFLSKTLNEADINKLYSELALLPE